MDHPLSKSAGASASNTLRSRPIARKKKQARIRSRPRYTFALREKCCAGWKSRSEPARIVLLSNCYPLSNEALAGERDVDLLAWVLGPNRQVIFDEHHLGISESGGIVTLARKFHLEGAAAMLLVLLGLFIWKNSGSLLPPAPEQAGPDESLVAKDARSGLANLLRRNIPVKQLMQTCLAEWENSRHGAKFYSQIKIDRVRSLARRDADVVETYRNVSQILSDRSDA